jgi:hypothetical protein
MPVDARLRSSASRWTTATSPSGECWIQTAYLVMPRRLREASYAVLRSPCQQERIALRSRSVLPGNSGMVNATACAVVVGSDIVIPPAQVSGLCLASSDGRTETSIPGNLGSLAHLMCQSWPPRATITHACGLGDGAARGGGSGLAVRGLRRDEYYRELAARLRRTIASDATCWHGVDPRTLQGLG